LNKIKANLYLNFKSSKSFLKVCAICTLPILLFFALSTMSMRSYREDVSINGTHHVSNSSSTFVAIILLLMMIYLIILSVSSPKGTFSLSIRMGSTRRDYFLGTLAYYAIISAAASIIHTVFFILEGILFKYLGINQLNNYSFIFDKISLVSAARLTIYNFLIFITIISVMTMLSHLAYIIGQYGWVIIIACIAVFIFKAVPSITNLMVNIKRTDFNLNMINFIISLAALVISYFLIRKTQIRNG